VWWCVVYDTTMPQTLHAAGPPKRAFHGLAKLSTTVSVWPCRSNIVTRAKRRGQQNQFLKKKMSCSSLSSLRRVT
jgi:hypothetical protein